MVLTAALKMFMQASHKYCMSTVCLNTENNVKST